MPAGARALTAGLVLLLTACTGSDGDAAGGDPPEGTPALEVTVVLDGLDHPWDVVQAPDGTLLVDERAGGLTAVRPDGTVREVAADFGDLVAEGETGLMGLALDPAFTENRRFYTCQGTRDGGVVIEVVAWTMAEDWSAAARLADPLIGGIPGNAASGRHGGCRVEFAADGALLVGTGDAADGTNPQDLTTLAGKVLRADPATGAALPDNPFAGPGNGAEDLIWTYGHRNVQGLAVRPGSGQVFSVEHGPDRDDEVNLLRPGANYGWDPDGDGGYDESVPMTDPGIPGAVEAVWSSGSPTIATSGATFVTGEEWGGYDGVLVVGVQKDTGLLALRLDADGALVEEFRVPELEDIYGRLRTPRLGGDGALYVTTDNGDGEDRLLRVTPA